MKRYKSPKVSEMVEAYHAVKAVGLRNVRLGNTGVFVSLGRGSSSSEGETWEQEIIEVQESK